MEEGINSVLNLQHLICSKNNNVQLFCCSQNCLNCALVCRHSNCQCLPKQHKNCQLVYTQSFINRIIQKKGVLTPQLQKAIQQIRKVYDQAIDKLSSDKQALVSWKQNYGLNQMQAKLLELINANKREEITGKLIHSVKQNIDHKLTYQWLNQQWVQQFWNKQKISFYQLFGRLNEFCQSYSNNQIVFPLPSVIAQDFNQISKFFDQPVKSFKLLYRASDQNFSAENFHQKCDGIKHTLTLVRTQFDTVIGGYTPIPWKSTQTSVVEADNSRESFLFSLTLDQKYLLTNPSIAVASNRIRGPMFGQGRDLCIADKANIKRQSFTNFPYSYNNGNYSNNQAAHTAISGNPRGYYMQLKQWEVFEVIWSNKRKKHDKIQ